MNISNTTVSILDLDLVTGGSGGVGPYIDEEHVLFVPAGKTAQQAAQQALTGAAKQLCDQIPATDPNQALCNKIIDGWSDLAYNGL